MANSDYRPEIGYLAPGGTESVDVIRRVDLLTGGSSSKSHGGRNPAQSWHTTVIAGSKPIRAAP